MSKKDDLTSKKMRDKWEGVNIIGEFAWVYCVSGVI